MIVARVRRTIRERQLIEPGMRVLAACSGGPDSAALLLVLARLSSELDFELEAASVDHGLRENAAADVELARAQALAAGVAFHPLRVHVERASSSSLQAAARTARYAALAELATRLGAQRVAVGHTQDDQAETVLMRMLRGAGIAGLASVEPLRRDGVIRPLIDCRRAAVAAFAAEHCVQVARDPSNVDLRFERVRVRAQLMPLLEREDPAVVPHLANLADDARAVTEALQEQARALLQASLQAGESIDVSRWTSAQPAVRTWALRLWLAQVTGVEPGRDHLVAVDRARGAPAEVWLPSGWVLRSRGDGRLLLSRAPGQK
jgi:tRNA(Ile)-lysidine synthase